MTSTITEPQLKPCPAWCTLVPGHDWDSYDRETDVHSRGHGGPTFGPYLHCGSTEGSDGSHVLEVFLSSDESGDVSPSALLDLAAHALLAAQWLERVQAEGRSSRSVSDRGVVPTPARAPWDVEIERQLEEGAL